MAGTYDPDSWPACWVLEILARTGSASEFYHSALWRRKSADVRRAQHHQCYCHLHPEKFPHLRGQRPAIVRAMVVHHVHPLRQRPDLALSDADELGRPNLICVCATCHWPLDHPTQPLPEIPERW